VTEQITVHPAVSYYVLARQQQLRLELGLTPQRNITMKPLKEKIILTGSKAEVDKLKREIEKIIYLDLGLKLQEHFARFYVSHPKIQQIIGTEVVVFFQFEKGSQYEQTSQQYDNVNCNHCCSIQRNRKISITNSY
jgi:hypothetical protein